MVSRRDEQQRRGVGADPVEREQAGGVRGDEGDDEFVEALELGVEELRAPFRPRSWARSPIRLSAASG
jgi:hypothetical protein